MQTDRGTIIRTKKKAKVKVYSKVIDNHMSSSRLADDRSPDDDAALVADEDDAVGVVVGGQRGGDHVEGDGHVGPVDVDPVRRVQHLEPH